MLRARPAALLTTPTLELKALWRELYDTVTADGFEWPVRPNNVLSAIIRAITGALDRPGRKRLLEDIEDRMVDTW